MFYFWNVVETFQSPYFRHLLSGCSSSEYLVSSFSNKSEELVHPPQLASSELKEVTVERVKAYETMKKVKIEPSKSTLDLLQIPDSIQGATSEAVKFHSQDLQTVHENWKVYDETFGVVPLSVLNVWNCSSSSSSSSSNSDSDSYCISDKSYSAFSVSFIHKKN